VLAQRIVQTLRQAPVVAPVAVSTAVPERISPPPVATKPEMSPPAPPVNIIPDPPTIPARTAWAFTPVTPETVWPAWLSQLRESAGNFENMCLFVQVLGDTGEARRSAVADGAAQRLGKARRSGTELRAFESLCAAGLVVNATALRGNIKAHLVHLTERGADMYRLLFGREPALQHAAAMIARHNNVHHAYLILEAQELLERAGYAVERYPEPLDLPQGQYRPDLAAIYAGQTLYIEAERGVHKNFAERRAKWEKAFRAGNGEVFLVVGSESELKALLSEVTYWAGTLKTAVRVRAFATEPLVLAKTTFPEGWAIWSVDQACE